MIFLNLFNWSSDVFEISVPIQNIYRLTRRLITRDLIPTLNRPRSLTADFNNSFLFFADDDGIYLISLAGRDPMQVGAKVYLKINIFFCRFVEKAWGEDISFILSYNTVVNQTTITQRSSQIQLSRCNVTAKLQLKF